MNSSKMANIENVEEFTQFRPLSPPTTERPTNSVTEFFMRFFDRGNPDEQATQSTQEKPSESSNDQIHSKSDLPPPTSTSTPSSPYTGRSLSTVTSRITNLLTRNAAGLGSTVSATSSNNEGEKSKRTLKDYNSSDFRQYWMPDSRGKECYECQEKFTTFRRRHHCRICGQIFCSRCCKQEIPGRMLGYVGDLRLCNYCCRVVLQYLNSPGNDRTWTRSGSSSGSESDVVQLRENLLRTLADSSSKKSNIQVHVDEVNVEDDQENDEELFGSVITPRKLSAASEAWTTPAGGHFTTPRQRQTSMTSSGDSQSIFGIDPHATLPRSSLLRSSSASLNTMNADGDANPINLDTENEEPDWLRLIETRDDGSQKRREIQEKSPDPILEPSMSVDRLDATTPKSTSTVSKRNSSRRKSISTDLFQRDEVAQRKTSKKGTTLAMPTRHFASTSPVLSKFRSASKQSSSNLQQRPTQSNVHYGSLHKTFDSEAQKVLECLLRRSNVNAQRWKPVLWPLCQEIAFSVQPQVRSRKDDIDALRYVHVKTLRSSLFPAAHVIFGTVCTKSVADKRMPQSYSHPSVFVVGGSVEYERVAGKFCPIDPIIMQERQYLQSLVRKIAALKPQILVVEKTVSRVAQEYFRQAGITLVFNMKPAVTRRIARCCEAGLAPSVEDQLIKPRMGRCGSFRTLTYSILTDQDDNHKPTATSAKSKSLMFFEDCPPDLGCAVILTGPNLKELRLVKRIVKFMIGAAYSTKLEIEFLRAYQICMDAESTLEKPLELNEDTWDESCPVCSKNNDLCVEKNVDTDGSGLDEEEEKLRGKFIQRVAETAFTFSSFVGEYLPYLQTLNGTKCTLRPYFNMQHLHRTGEDEVLNNATAEIEDKATPTPEVDDTDENVCQELFQHGFVKEKLTNPAESLDVRSKLAQYRAQSAKLFRKNLEVLRRNETNSKPDLNADTKSMDSGLDELKGSSEQSSAFIDVLDPFLHRRIAVLYSSYSPKSENAPGFCLKPRVFVMHFYGRFDVTLGDYLERFCFDPAYECANESCDASMITHVRKLVHGNCCVEITTQNLDVPGGEAAKNADSVDQHILVWNYCCVCKTTTPATPMNTEFWHLSFARYLEYLFNGKCLGSYTVRDARCTHCLFHQHQHYFAFRNSVVCFKCSPIILYDLVFPPSVCGYDPELINAMDLVEETMKLSEKAGEIFSHMVEILCAMRSLITVDNSVTNPTSGAPFYIAQFASDLTQVHETEQETFRNQLGQAQAILPTFHTGDELETNDERYLTIVDSHAVCRHILARCVQQWNFQISDMIGALKKKPTVETKSMGPADDSSVEKTMVNTSPNAALNTSNGPNSERPSSGSEDSTKRSSSDASDKKQFAKILNSASLTSPFEASDHFSILPNTAKHTPIVMRDNEIGSIVAFALCSDDYENQRKSTRDVWSAEGVVLNLKNTAGPTDSESIGQNSTSATDQEDGNASSGQQQHIELQFNDGAAKFYCKIYYAEKFRLLRKLIFTEGEETFARSLARSKPWQPKGGRSGASFYITHDNRFILKQLSRFELQSLLKFAPNYFQYMASASTENKLTALAKICGAYRIGFRNPQTNAATKLDLLVMENLFYNRNIVQMYDLKGSLRNRFVSEKHQADLVLMDENLLKTVCTNSFYLYPHSKSALNVAINNDSKFLAANSIMDYSLLVGVDEERRELVLGIIDFVRTFTWDKKVESWVKSVSVTGQLPTVISPDLYRDRFVEIMDIYFPVAPDQWFING